MADVLSSMLSGLNDYQPKTQCQAQGEEFVAQLDRHFGLGGSSPINLVAFS